jgi:hypothetical protein
VKLLYPYLPGVLFQTRGYLVDQVV